MTDDQLVDLMRTCRRAIHETSEMAFEEHMTSGLLATTLRDNGIELFEGIGRTCVVAVLRNGEGPSIGLRADMNQTRYEGEKDASGQDRHASMLLGAALYLNANRSWAGTVHFIFQPAEEMLGDDSFVVEEGFFQRFPCDAVYSLHNWPGLPASPLAFETFEILVEGKGVYAAMPDRCTGPVVIVSRLLSSTGARRESRRDTGHSYSYANPWGRCLKRHTGTGNRPAAYLKYFKSICSPF